ncbi:MAG TPA: winged helix-turn-helix domain-containing protein [Thermoanaerobaculia bacterium]|jgi:DNA-binding winged helix-turn-helix (wHTH) protein/tetratricopeptide (TPR) repeat protein|nr:winged helix-turn-helix domain-containing protein [Thermoanaerobaculia bacterium]
MRVRFLGFTLDAEAGWLSGPDGEVRLRPQAFRMLLVLVESAPKILSQENLLDRVWGVEHLSPASVKQAVSEVRQALGDDPARPRIIETVHRRGYRFIAALAPVDEAEEVQEVQDLLAPVAAAPLPARPPRRHVLLRASLLAGFAAVSLLEGSMPPSAARSAASTSRVARVARADHAAGRPTVAILGFRNLSARPEDGWISAALSETLRFELTTPGTVRLIPADNVVRMQRELGIADGTVADAGLARIGANLGTRLVVGGSYLVSPSAGGVGGARVRIQVMVEDVRSGETVAWARQTGSTADLLDLSRAAARGILGSLGYDPGGPSGEAAALAANGESLRLWAEAMSRLRVRDAMGAISRLQKARETDPENPFVDDALAVAWSRLGFDSRAAEAAGRALSRAGRLPEEIRWALTARAHEMRFEMAEAARLYEKLWNRYSDNLDYGLSLAAAQRQSGAPEVSFATVAKLRNLAAPDGLDPRVDLAESDAAWGVGDFPRCRDAAERAIEKAEARRATLLAAAGRIARGWAYIRLGRLDTARVDFRAAGGIYRRVGDRGAAAGALAAEALIDQSEGRVSEARQIYEQAIRVFHEVGDRTREAKSLNNLAALVGESDWATTSRLLSRSLAIKREIDDAQGIALTLANLGSVRQTLGDTKGARPYLKEALEISRRLGDAHGIAQALRGIAEVEMKERHFDRARANLEEALGLSRQNGDAEGLARAAALLKLAG